MKKERDAALTTINLCQQSVLIRVLLLSQALGLLLVISPINSQYDFLIVWSAVTFSCLWVSIVSLLLSCVITKALRVKRAYSVFLIIFVVVALVTLVFSYFSFPFVSGSGVISDMTVTDFVLKSVGVSIIMTLVGALYLSMYFESIERINAQANAELDALHAQIRPHFLFNCLNTVAELIHVSPKDAEKSIMNLSGLFRAALAAKSSSTLEEEIELTKQYLELEKWRLAERLSVHWKLPSEYPAVYLPVLTIQPLVENAVKHGIEPGVYGGKVSIEVNIGNKWVTTIITNAINQDFSPHQNGAGISILNIERRLQYFFEGRANLACFTSENEFRVKLTIPYGD
ncbi:sensor histidine kinase [Nitrincola schmidtii]|uniref:sensor histidine kinase n=1 Tax=Nitrincola schmidtii TaxID=1730894 RepID=UPI00124E3290|nr:histidine kinase [Nitrincola schmidtii]